MTRRWLQTLVAAGCGLALAAISATAYAQTYVREQSPRFALLIGNRSYDGKDQPPLPDLNNPCNDAELVAAELIRANWKEEDIVVACDLDDDATYAALKRFMLRFDYAFQPTALLYLSGHGAQIDDETYLFEAKAKPDIAKQAHSYVTDKKVPLFFGDALSLRAYLRHSVGDVAQRKGALVVVVDACRDNPLSDMIQQLAAQAKVSAPQMVDHPHGILMAYSTSKGKTASDGIGANSLFASALADAIRYGDPSDSFDDLFNGVTDTLVDITHDMSYFQQPSKDGTLPKPKRCIRPCDIPPPPPLSTTASVEEKPLLQLARYLVDPAASSAPAKPAVPADTSAYRVIYDAPRPRPEDPAARLPVVSLEVLWCANDSLTESRRVAASEFAVAAATFGRYAGLDGSRLIRVTVGPLAIEDAQATGYTAAGNVLLYAVDPVSTSWADKLPQVSLTSSVRAVVSPDAREGALRMLVCNGVDVDHRPAQVFMQTASREQNALADTLGRDLSAAVPGIKVLPIDLEAAASPDAPDVRFFYRSDELTARRIAGVASKALGRRVPAKFFDKIERKPLAGTIEIWLGKDIIPTGSN